MNLPYMERVESSNVSSLGYDDSSERLFIKFNSGAIYVYYDVPIEEYNNLLTASSIGSYVWTNIRDRYTYENIS